MQESIAFNTLVLLLLNGFTIENCFLFWKSGKATLKMMLILTNAVLIVSILLSA